MWQWRRVSLCPRCELYEKIMGHEVLELKPAYHGVVFQITHADPSVSPIILIVQSLRTQSCVVDTWIAISGAGLNI